MKIDGLKATYVAKWKKILAENQRAKLTQQQQQAVADMEKPTQKEKPKQKKGGILGLFGFKS